jgi:hypothetical protein
MPVIGALEAPHSHFEVATLYPYCFAIQQCIGHLLPGGNKNALKSGSRDTHLVRPFLLLQTLQILQADCLSLIYRNTYFFKHPHGYPSWLEIRDLWQRIDSATYGRSTSDHISILALSRLQ